jgi:hypothetical protein
MKKRLFVVLVLAVVLFGSTFFAYSYWDNLQQSQSETITVGNGVTLQVAAQATVPSGKVLVPAGVVMKADDVNSVVLTYNVKLDQAANTALDLSVTSSNVEIGNATDNSGLVNIDISQAASTVNDSNVLVTVTVTLDEPGTVTAYNAIINQPITFDLTFTASQPA